ncbi:hypothetical protein Tco_1551268 [Tanacetum coccineum]
MNIAEADVAAGEDANLYVYVMTCYAMKHGICAAGAVLAFFKCRIWCHCLYYLNLGYTIDQCLDERTSNVDTQTVTKMKDAISSEREGLAVITISCETIV